MIPTLSLILALSSGFLNTARADWNEPHVDGAKEHPFLKFYPESRVQQYQQMDFDSEEMVVGYKSKSATEGEFKTETIEGRITKYTLEHKPNTSVLAITRNIEAALKRGGYLIDKCDLMKKMPGTERFDESNGFCMAKVQKGGKTTGYITLRVYNSGGPELSYTEVIIAEPKQLQLDYTTSASEIYDELQKSGKVAIYGINFDTGKSTITADSEKVLGEVQKLCTDHVDLKLSIEGHTDNVGAAADNQRLSEARAAAVKTWLTGKGVAAGRLSSRGWGQTKPLAANDTDENKAKNRRVELVKQ